MSATAVDLAGHKWIRGAYLSGQKDLLWILAIANGAHAEVSALLLTDFKNLSGTPRYCALQQSLTA
jgi:hypothetical protein